MERPQPTPLLDPLTTILSRENVIRKAKKMNVIKRKSRKVDIYILILTLVLAVSAGQERTIDGLRKEYQRAARKTVARSSFYERLTPQLTALMKALVMEAIKTTDTAFSMPPGWLHGFKDLLAIDASVLRLHKLLAKTFPATRTNHTKAAAKIHMVMSVLSIMPTKVKLTSERVGDTTPWKRLGSWVRGCLLLVDLGYYEFNLFDRIEQKGGFFLSRAKSNFKGVIVSSNRTCRGRSITVIGKKVQDVLPHLQREVLDVMVEVSFPKRKYRGEIRIKTRTFRLVGARNAESGKYHVYLTNLPPDQLSAEDISKTYALRWQVELFFKMMKSQMKMDHLPSSKRHIVELLIWSSVLLSILSGNLYRSIRLLVGADRHLPMLRWGRLFSSSSRDLLRLLVSPISTECDALLEHFLHESPDPNRKRKNRALEPIPLPKAA